MKTAERENPNRRPQYVANRADGAASQYRSCSIMWAAKQENFQPAEKCFFLTSPFIDLTGQVRPSTHIDGYRVNQDLGATHQSRSPFAWRCAESNPLNCYSNFKLTRTRARIVTSPPARVDCSCCIGIL